MNFSTGEIYHVYNRGVEKRNVFLDSFDLSRFFQGMKEFNTTDPIGSLYAQSFKKEYEQLSVPGAKYVKKIPLVNFIAYCLNPNHYHFVLEQNVDGGISKFMMKLCGGYAWYFNNKYQRNGTLFQGRFKAVHVNSNEYLLHVSAYVNLNNRAHRLRDSSAKFSSSWNEYTDAKWNQGNPFCKKDIVLDQFKNIALYKKFAKDSLGTILENKQKQKELDKELAGLLIE